MTDHTAAARPAFAVLAHERLDRAAALVQALAPHGPVAVHLDASVTDHGPLADVPAQVIQTRRAEWGRIGLVEASLDLARVLLAQNVSAENPGRENPGTENARPENARTENPSHICLLSGACLPIRPVPDLAAHLAPGRDYIESIPADQGWVQDGLSAERFTLYHPFSFRTQRWWFDRSVDLQRAFGVHRRLPGGIAPHLGLQWWCLSAETLTRLLDDARLPAWLRFFRRTWIPDEGFFQSLQRAVGDHPPLPTMHLNRFDPRGRPYVFHDDHVGLLTKADAFFARKIDPDADVLYRTFLPEPPQGPRCPVDETRFNAARAQEVTGGRGQLSPARYPGGTTQSAVQTAAPYLVLVAEDAALLTGLRQALGAVPGAILHGLLFQQDLPAAFADGGAFTWGNLPADPAIRSYRPAQFLARLVWAERGQKTVFGFVPGPPSAIAGQIIGDGNARILLLGDAARLTALMTAPLPVKRRRRLRPRQPKPREIWAWTRVLDGAALADQIRQGDAIALDQVRDAIASDWRDPAGWTVPPDWKDPA